MYVADAKLGVRLAPGAEEDISFGGNPISHVRINADGYRGADLPPAGKDDVLVVGDSQVFGLGVEEDQTFSTKLAGALHRTVINAGVPTYGPGEYRAVIAEMLAKRHPRTVVLTLNLVNDLFEAEHPNTERHAVWDGWAVRKENAPTDVTRFPGRDFLYRRSHLFFAYRKWKHGEPGDDRGVASEGTWRDVIATGSELSQKRKAIDAQRKKHLDDITQVHHRIGDDDGELAEKIRELVDQGTLTRNEDFVSEQLAVFNAAGNPGDIVTDSFSEAARPSFVTADQLATAVAVRARLRKELAAWAKAHQSNDTAREALGELDDIQQAAAKLSQLDVEKLQLALEPPLAGYLRDVKQLVEQDGARLVVVILPIDVQVSADEWKKYGHAPIDMAPSRALNDELAALARSLGLSVLDAAPTLAAAEPGAFLDKDIHMTAKGHAAVASALAQVIAAPPPTAIPSVASSRSPVPLPAVFQRAPEVIVTGSSEAACETKQVREWLRIECPITDTVAPLDLKITRDDGGEAMALVERAELALLVPVVDGRELDATFTWTNASRALHIRWQAGKPKFFFDKAVPRTRQAGDPAEWSDGNIPEQLKFRGPTELAICWCWWSTFGGASEGTAMAQPEAATCIGAYGAADPTCVASYGGGTDVKQCPALLACTRRDPAFPPTVTPAAAAQVLEQATAQRKAAQLELLEQTEERQKHKHSLGAP
jgi:hypothetical protein